MQAFTGIFGVVFIVVFTGLILYPTVRHGNDLFTVRNLFLLGGIPFVGFAAITHANTHLSDHLADYQTATYWRYFISITLFYTVLLLVYHKTQWPQRVAGKRLLNWPQITPIALLMIVPVVLVMSAIRVVRIPVPVLFELSGLLGDKLPMILVVLVLAGLLVDKGNPLLWALLVVAVTVSLVLGFYGSIGRRNLVALVAVIPFSLYWFKLRYAPRKQLLAWTAVFMIGGALVVVGYGSVRHTIHGMDMTLGNTWKLVERLPSGIINGDWDTILQQDTVDTSLVSIEFYTGRFEHAVSPFHSLYFVAVNPIPRRFFPDKPIGLGYLLPQVHYNLYGSQATWGPSVVGHAYHEGGMWMILVYAVLAGLAVRIADELLLRQSNNPFVVAAVAVSAGHIIGWVRGDIGTFTIQILSVIVATLLLAAIAGLFFGRSLRYPPLPEVHREYFGRAAIRRAQGLPEG
ncbi:MAG: hypothetical protein AAGI68_07780 [Planctomycetota bacterium]